MKEENVNCSEDNRPNILFIMTDQQRYDSLGCYGSKAARTPNLDLMAERGVVFENCVCSSAVCTPARASIWTGKEIPDHGVYSINDALRPEEVLFSKHLQNQGYYTGLFGKLHVSGHAYEEVSRHPNDGFDEYEWCPAPWHSMDSKFNAYSKWLKEKDPVFLERVRQIGNNTKNIERDIHMTHWAAERTIDFITRASKKQQPFFATMSVFDPHGHYDDGPEEYFERIDPKEISEPLTTPFDRRPRTHVRDNEKNYAGCFATYSKRKIMQEKRWYHAMIALIDDEVGRVLEALEASGASDNTLVIFTSDHGDIQFDHQLLRKGAYYYDPLIKVPLIMRFPKSIPANKRISSMVQINDIAATCLDFAGCDGSSLPATSKSLKPLISGEVPSVRDYAISRTYTLADLAAGQPWVEGYFGQIYSMMLRTEEWKVAVYEDDELGELYNMKADPDEQNNLWDLPEYAQIQKHLLGLVTENGGGELVTECNYEKKAL